MDPFFESGLTVSHQFMNKTEEELRRLSEWRRKKNITVERSEQIQRSYIVEPEEIPNFHFFCYDPDAPDLSDLSDVSLRRDDKADRAVFSIPIAFTEKHKTVYKRHDRSELGFDVRLYLTRNNAPIYPIRKY